ncbi:glycosyltransferase family 2 protein [Parapedobacter sp. 10938]|uniref:glycosyltransferase family 2 protein n=1 Tax=Parapedobacter flavus TaxID=3110225 RepID=UPI002DC00193|nr:glycosyltransferase family 2 protein [Parapedobacter sp. 10938]MEC3880614.1 glycosyltransferase family 2 protein [Parapedobacter sp. 10938]
MDNSYVIVPVFNEDVDLVRKTVERLSRLPLNIVVVDDGNDPSLEGDIADLPVYYVRHGVNLGQGAALQTGIEFAARMGGDTFVTFDADGQHNENDIVGLITALRREKLDVVFGSRFMTAGSNVPWSRKIILKGAIWVNYLFTGIRMTDAHNGLRVFNTNAVPAFRFRENRMAYATELLLNMKANRLTFGERPVKISYTGYSLQKGQRNIDSLFVLKDLIIHKILRS